MVPSHSPYQCWSVGLPHADLHHPLGWVRIMLRRPRLRLAISKPIVDLPCREWQERVGEWGDWRGRDSMVGAFRHVR